jgi:cardiolipin synthase (CMP-forming)
VNIPNTITSIRFILIPVFAFYLYQGQYFMAILFFLIGGLSDILDGYIARKLNMVTSFGKLVDPVADKLMQITALIILTMQRMLPSIILIIVIAKEAFMGMGSILLYKKKNVVVSANWYGKLATVIFYIAIVITIILNQFNTNGRELLIDILMGVAVLATLFAFFMYSMTYRSIGNEEKE